MNWDAIGATGEVLGAVAVVGTLVYLARQLRENTRSMETQSRQAAANEFRAWNLMLMDRYDEFAMGMRYYPDMPPLPRNVFSTVCHDLLLFMQSIIALHNSGSLDDDTWDSYLNWVASVMSSPGGEAFWAEWQNVYNESLRSTLNARIASAELPDVLQFRQWADRGFLPGAESDTAAPTS